LPVSLGAAHPAGRHRGDRGHDRLWQAAVGRHWRISRRDPLPGEDDIPDHEQGTYDRDFAPYGRRHAAFGLVFRQTFRQVCRCVQKGGDDHPKPGSNETSLRKAVRTP
jgi:hypothetical protein